jgi:predicted enzyme related to lactoylglutathione lyase
MDYWLIMTGKEKELGIDGGLSIRTEAKPSTVNTIDVASVDKYLKKIVDNGGKIVRPKMAVPGSGGWHFSKTLRETPGAHGKRRVCSIAFDASD